MAKLKLTPELIEKLIPAIEAGNYIETVCQAMGIDKSTYYKWIKKGEKAKSGIYRHFFHSVKNAEARAEARLIEEWREKLKESPTNYKDFLERRYPERWGKKDIVKHQGDNENPITYTVKFVDGHPDPDHREIREVSQPDPKEN